AAQAGWIEVPRTLRVAFSQPEFGRCLNACRPSATHPARLVDSLISQWPPSKYNSRSIFRMTFPGALPGSRHLERDTSVAVIHARTRTAGFTRRAALWLRRHRTGLVLHRSLDLEAPLLSELPSPIFSTRTSYRRLTRRRALPS